MRRATSVTPARVGAGNAKDARGANGDQLGDGFHAHVFLNVI